jgi:hypothetical protein
MVTYQLCTTPAGYRGARGAAIRPLVVTPRVSYRGTAPPPADYVAGTQAVRRTTFVLRTPVFALGAARRAQWTTFVLRTPVFALGAARRAHAASAVPCDRA